MVLVYEINKVLWNIYMQRIYARSCGIEFKTSNISCVGFLLSLKYYLILMTNMSPWSSGYTGEINWSYHGPESIFGFCTQWCLLGDGALSPKRR